MSLWRWTYRLGLLASAPVVFAACASAAGTSPPLATPGSAVGAAPLNQRVVDLAVESIGSPYKWGGTDANGFDCSGLIQFAYGEFGIDLPRVSTAQIREGWPVGLSLGQLRPGDILGFSLESPGETSHVGLYLGENEFIHSSSTGVRVSNLMNPYWQEHLVAARRIVE